MDTANESFVQNNLLTSNIQQRNSFAIQELLGLTETSSNSGPKGAGPEGPEGNHGLYSSSSQAAAAAHTHSVFSSAASLVNTAKSLVSFN